MTVVQVMGILLVVAALISAFMENQKAGLIILWAMITLIIFEDWKNRKNNP